MVIKKISVTMVNKYFYEKDSLLYNKITRGKAKKDTPSGSINSNGYLCTWIKGNFYKTHRLLFVLRNGYDPANIIDHKNKSSLDNTKSNHREVSHQCNSRNSSISSRNKSGIKGVSWHKHSKSWHVSIGLDYRLHVIGYFKDFEEAVCNRLAIEQCLNWAGCESNSPAYTYVANLKQSNKGEMTNDKETRLRTL